MRSPWNPFRGSGMLRVVEYRFGLLDIHPSTCLSAHLSVLGKHLWAWCLTSTFSFLSIILFMDTTGLSILPLFTFVARTLPKCSAAGWGQQRSFEMVYPGWFNEARKGGCNGWIAQSGIIFYVTLALKSSSKSLHWSPGPVMSSWDI